MLAKHALIDGVHCWNSFMSMRKTPQRSTCLQIGSAGLQDRLQVLQALLRLRSDVGAGELAGRRIGRALPDTKIRRSKPMPGEYGPTGFGKIARRAQAYV
jgi:hypothetical protein